MYTDELGKSSLTVSYQWTCTLVRPPFLIFAFCEAHIVGLISTKCTRMLLSGMSIENTMEKIVQYAPFNH